jgi:lipopolysaccharide export LptBFGC system permease protein LptF
MSRTLFWYVFKDLMKIFFMASGALAGIMSFAGLLRPLTQKGLDGWQVALLLRYLMPAMSAYSLPVAALFATTVVYGRMSADNEVTACRACGISFLSMTMPAMLLGLFVGMASMFMLCFTVPNATMKIEQVIVSNLGGLIAHQIEQTHEVPFPDNKFTVFAQAAELMEPDPTTPDLQAVLLHGPMIVRYIVPPGRDKYFKVAKEFLMAKSAVVYVHQNPDSSASIQVALSDGMKFPRRFTDPSSEQGGFATAQFGPEPIPSGLGEKTKFMNIFQLKELERDPTRGHDVRDVTGQYIQQDQSDAYASQLVDALNGPQGRCVLQTGADTYTLIRSDAPATLRGNSIAIAAGAKPLLFRQESGGQTRLTAEAHSVQITVAAETVNEQLDISMELKDALVDAGDTPSPKAAFVQKFVVPMPTDITTMRERTSEQYLFGELRPPADRALLLRAWVDLINHIRSEMHARAAFVVSCLLLVLIGASLGMMFRSGNFLTAFAVSVIPAMLCIVLIVTGQHTLESSLRWTSDFHNQLSAGVMLIWSGNVAIALAAFALLFRLQRQ